MRTPVARGIVLLVLVSPGGCGRGAIEQAPIVEDLIAAFPAAAVQPAPPSVGRQPPCPAARVVPEQEELFVPFGARVDYRFRASPDSFLTFTGPLPAGDVRGELAIVVEPDGGGPGRTLATLRSSTARQVVPLGGPPGPVRLSLRSASGAYPSPGCGITLRRPAVRTWGAR